MKKKSKWVKCDNSDERAGTEAKVRNVNIPGLGMFHLQAFAIWDHSKGMVNEFGYEVSCPTREMHDYINGTDFLKSAKTLNAATRKCDDLFKKYLKSLKE